MRHGAPRGAEEFDCQFGHDSTKISVSRSPRQFRNFLMLNLPTCHDLVSGCRAMRIFSSSFD
jgi:hypothetical protein